MKGKKVEEEEEYKDECKRGRRMKGKNKVMEKEGLEKERIIIGE